MYQKILKNVKEHPSLIHCITNYVTVNDVANMILASGGSPIMADDKQEVEEITGICTALVLNIGTLNERTVESMILAGKRANNLGHPVIFDPVGAGASTFRTQTAVKLLKEVNFSVIRGNISEIMTLCVGSGTTMGVDANEADAVTEENMDTIIAMARDFSVKMKAVIAITGAMDLIVNEEATYVVYNGDPMMSQITGTGCMLDGVIGSFVGSNPEDTLEAVVTAVSAMGLCGQKAKKICDGTASFRVHLLDAMSRLTEEEMRRESKIEHKS